MPRKLTPAQASYVRKAFRLRERLTDKALCERFKVCPVTLYNYGNGLHGKRAKAKRVAWHTERKERGGGV